MLPTELGKDELVRVIYKNKAGFAPLGDVDSVLFKHAMSWSCHSARRGESKENHHHIRDFFFKKRYRAAAFVRDARRILEKHASAEQIDLTHEVEK